MPYGTCNILYEKNKEIGILIEQLDDKSRIKIFQSCNECGQIFMRSFLYRNSLHKCKPFFDGTKKCCICHIKKTADEFPKNRSSFDGYGKICKDCFSNMPSVKKHYKNKSEKNKSDLEFYLKNKASHIKSRLKMKKRNLDNNVTGELLIELYKKQNGRCYYSGIEINHNQDCSFDSISVDRLDSNIGYIEGNVVLCANGINAMKGILSELEFKEVLHKVIPGLMLYKGA